MIIWLASYPKSGNTFLRSLISAYFFTKDGNFNFEVLKNIKQFPDNGVFEKLGIDISNQKEIIKNYVKVQEESNRIDGAKVRFLKTHSVLNDINGYKFTDLNNSLGVIYVVRDPRTTATSYANHYQISSDAAIERMKKFAKETGLLVGISSGANILSAEKYIDMHEPEGVVVTMLCDRGERYL